MKPTRCTFCREYRAFADTDGEWCGCNRGVWKMEREDFTIAEYNENIKEAKGCKISGMGGQ